MGRAVDTVGFSATNAAAAGKAATVATGDSFTIKNFAASATAKLIGVFRQDNGGTAGFVQLKSSRFSNDTTGVKVNIGENPAREALPMYGLQTLYSGDTLTVNISGHTAATTGGHTAGAFQVNYSTVDGLSARLHSWADIAGAIGNLFTQDVKVKTSAIGTWKDTLTNATADLMHADTTYALLGYNVSTAVCAVGVKGQETGNLRVCGPGTIDTANTSWYYVEKSNALGEPFIPVFNANNRGNIYATTIADAATVTANVNLLWAELTTKLTP